MPSTEASRVSAAAAVAAVRERGGGLRFNDDLPLSSSFSLSPGAARPPARSFARSVGPLISRRPQKRRRRRSVQRRRARRSAATGASSEMENRSDRQPRRKRRRRRRRKRTFRPSSSWCANTTTTLPSHVDRKEEELFRSARTTTI